MGRPRLFDRGLGPIVPSSVKTLDTLATTDKPLRKDPCRMIVSRHGDRLCTRSGVMYPPKRLAVLNGLPGAKRLVSCGRQAVLASSRLSPTTRPCGRMRPTAGAPTHCTFAQMRFHLCQTLLRKVPQVPAFGFLSGTFLEPVSNTEPAAISPAKGRSATTFL